MSTRAENVARAQQLRSEGWLFREIADYMDVAVSTVDSWLNDPDGSRQRARKDSYRGECLDCGAPTDGSDGPNAPAVRCQACNGQVTAKRERQLWQAHREHVEAMWAAGFKMKEIAAATGCTLNISTLRARGYNLPYRYSEERIAKMTAGCEDRLANARAAYASRRAA